MSHVFEKLHMVTGILENRLEYGALLAFLDLKAAGVGFLLAGKLADRQLDEPQQITRHPVKIHPSKYHEVSRI